MNTNQEAMYLVKFLAKKIKKLEEENEQLRGELAENEHLVLKGTYFYTVETDLKIMAAPSLKAALHLKKDQMKHNPVIKTFNTNLELKKYIKNFRPKAVSEPNSSINQTKVQTDKYIPEFKPKIAPTSFYVVETDSKLFDTNNIQMAKNKMAQQKGGNPRIIGFTTMDEKTAYIEKYNSRKKAVEKARQLKKENDKNEFNNKKLAAKKKGYETIFYVDGSSKEHMKLFSSAFVMEIGDEYVKEQSFTFHESKARGNCACQSAEFTAAMLAVIEAKRRGLKKFAIVYDRADIFTCFINKPKTNKIGMAFHKWMKEETKGMDIKFIKAKSHCGIKGNERADFLANQAIRQPKKIYA